MYITLLIFISVLSQICPKVTSDTVFPAQLSSFFNGSFISKVKGAYDNEKKSYKAEGFNFNWDIYNFHHVCVRSGIDGLVIGIDGRDNDWTTKHLNIPDLVSEKEWNDVLKKKKSMKIPLVAKRVKLMSYNVTMKKGNTLFSNCYQQALDSTNPAHLLMKVGLIYELSVCYSRNNEAAIFKDFLSLRFRNMFMHQCPDPNTTDWKWGQNIMDIITRKTTEVTQFYDGEPAQRTIDIVGYPKDGLGDFRTLTCFEDLFVSMRNGIWLQMPFNQINFRKDTAKYIGEPKQALSKPETVAAILPSRARQDYCPPDGSKKSTARIKVFERSATRMLRKFLNMDEVVTIAQDFTSVPVEIVTVNDTTSVLDQIRLFNSFDVLITSHGSHLANGIFTVRPERKAIVEVVSFAYDKVFYGNYNMHLGFADYIMSTGHLNSPMSILDKPCPFLSFSDFAAKDCTLTKHAYTARDKVEQSFYSCPLLHQTRGCDNIINTTAFRSHLEHLFEKSLCIETNK